MAKISDTTTYPVITPTTDDTLIGTNTTDGVTRNFAISGILGLAVPTGGTTGQVLAKNSGTSYDTEWTDASVGVTDGDKGDVVVSSSGAVWSLDSSVVTTAARTVLDDASTSAMLTTLGAPALAAANTFTLGPNAFRAGADANVALVARRHSSGATANIFEAQNEGGTALAYLTEDGRSVAPRVSIGVENWGFSFGSTMGDNYFNIEFTITELLNGFTTHYHNVFNFYVNVTDTTDTSVVDGQVFGYGGYLGISGTRIPRYVYGFSSQIDHETATNGTERLIGFDNQVFTYGGGTIGRMTAYQAYLDNGGGANVTTGAILYAPTINDSGGTFTNLYGLLLGNVVGGTVENYAIKTGSGPIHFGDYMELAKVTAPGNSPANTGYLFLRDNGGGKMQIAAHFPSGAIQVIATEP